MTQPDPDLEPRLTDVEARISFLEDSLTQLDAVVREVADELALLRRSMKELRGRVDAGPETAPAANPDLQYEKPPHY